MIGGLIETIFLAQRLDLFGVDVFALRGELGHVAFEVVAGRQFDDGEDER